MAMPSRRRMMEPTIPSPATAVRRRVRARSPLPRFPVRRRHHYVVARRLKDCCRLLATSRTEIPSSPAQEWSTVHAIPNPTNLEAYLAIQIRQLAPVIQHRSAVQGRQSPRAQCAKGGPAKAHRDRRNSHPRDPSAVDERRATDERADARSGLDVVEVRVEHVHRRNAVDGQPIALGGLADRLFVRPITKAVDLRLSMVTYSGPRSRQLQRS